MTETPLDQLCRSLQQELSRDPRGAGIVALLERYARTQEDWREYVHWCDERYTRNLVHRCGEYELLLLCWKPDQVSPIHDHAGQHCWMAVLEGQLEEVHYRTEDCGTLSCGRSKSYDAGGVAFIQDEIAWHLIRPVGDHPSVSLHLYANPIDSCRVFCPDTGTPAEAHMGYHSVRGELCTDTPAEAIRAPVLVRTGALPGAPPPRRSGLGAGGTGTHERARQPGRADALASLSSRVPTRLGRRGACRTGEAIRTGRGERA